MAIERHHIGRTLVGGVGRLAGRRWWREVLFVLGFYGLYDTIRGLLVGDATRAQRNGNEILALERALGLDPEHWLNDALGRVPALAVTACVCYATLHFLVTAAVLVWCYRSHPESYRQARITLGLITATALAGFWLFPTAPPRLLVGGGYHDTLQLFSRWGWWGTDGAGHGAAAIANQYAAMPSLHVAWAAWCAGTVYRRTTSSLLRFGAACYPMIIVGVVIGTANHYLLDVLAGIALCVCASIAVEQLGPLPLRDFARREPNLVGDLSKA